MNNLNTIITESESTDKELSKFHSDIYFKSLMLKHKNLFNLNDYYDEITISDISSPKVMTYGYANIARYVFSEDEFNVISTIIERFYKNDDYKYISLDCVNKFMEIFDIFKKENKPYMIFLNKSKKQVTVMITAARIDYSYNEDTFKNFMLIDSLFEVSSNASLDKQQ